jgi:1-deoxy-D-xylulose-5-phosphate reductoisomerase
VLNAANEVAVAEFLAGRIAFPRIWETVAAVLGQMPDAPASSLDAILAADAEARQRAAAVARA